MFAASQSKYETAPVNKQSASIHVTEKGGPCAAFAASSSDTRTPACLVTAVGSTRSEPDALNVLHPGIEPSFGMPTRTPW